MPRWEWRTDDDDELRGMQTVLAGAGIEFSIVDEGETSILITHDVDRATELEARMVQHHSRELSRTLGRRLDHREQWSRNGLALLVGVLGLLLAVAVLLRLH